MINKSLAENLASVKARMSQSGLQDGHDRLRAKLVAVSKTRDAASVRALFDLGIADFGENYLQEALNKMDTLQDLPISWHFIGTIQSNKTALIAQHFDWVQTLDRFKVASRLNEQRPLQQGPLNVLIQVNLDAEPSKGGIAPETIQSFAADLSELERIKLRGLMFIPKAQQDPDKQKEQCQRARMHFDLLKQFSPEVDTLSLGMSADLEPALAAGSTMVRIGTDLFGPRELK